MKTETKHTPGPWRWERIEGRRKVFMPDDYMLVGNDSQRLGFCASAFQAENRVPEGVDGQNARLIAAAPELLEAARAVLLAEKDDWREPTRSLAASAARTAVAKAVSQEAA